MNKRWAARLAAAAVLTGLTGISSLAATDGGGGDECSVGKR